MAHLYVATSQKSTAIQTTIICKFTGPQDENLLIARGSHLDIYRVTSEALIFCKSIPFYGKITKIQNFRHIGQVTDSIFLLTEKKHFCVIIWDQLEQRPVIRATGNLKDRGTKESESGHFCLVDPDNKVIGVVLHEGQMKFIPIEQNGFREAFPVRLDFLKVVDIVFLHGYSQPTICVLHEDPFQSLHIHTYHVDLREKELVPGPFCHANVVFDTRFLVPVPSPAGGVLAVGCSSSSYIPGTQNQTPSSSSSSSISATPLIQSVAFDPCQVCAWSSLGALDALGLRVLIGDHRGHLQLLTMCLSTTQPSTVVELCITPLGVSCIPHALKHLGGGLVLVASLYADPQIVRINTTPDEEGNWLSPVDPSWSKQLENPANLGPIVDMVVVEGERQGQCQVVCCSGAYQDGSLRVVRSGVGISLQASLEVQGLKSVFPLRPSSSPSTPYHSHLLQAYTGETRLLGIGVDERGDAQIEEVEMIDFESSQQTLFCGNMQDSYIVQVLPNKVLLLDAAQGFKLVQEYIPPSQNTETSGFSSSFSSDEDMASSGPTITTATANQHQLVLSLSGGIVMLLGLQDTPSSNTFESDSTDSKQLVLLQSVRLENDVACLFLRPQTSLGEMEEGFPQSEVGISDVLAVGMWTENTVRLLAMPSLQELSRVQLDSDSQIRDLLIVRFGAVSHILVGLGDGSLVAFTLDFSEDFPSFNLPSRRKISLGLRPISFTPFQHDNNICIFAACDRPTVIYSSNSKLLFSVANIQEEVINMSPFHCQQFPDCLCLVSESTLSIGSIDSIQKVHVESLPLFQSPRRISHLKQSESFILVTERTEISEQGEMTSHQVLFLHENTKQPFFTFDLDPLEQGLSTFSCSFQVHPGIVKEVVIVGTAYLIHGEMEPSKGRLLIFEVTVSEEGEKYVTKLAHLVVNGPVFSLSAVSNHIVAGIGSEVTVIRIASPPDGAASLQVVSKHLGHIMALYLKSRGDFLLVGDLLRSLTLLRFQPQNGKLVEVARDYNCNYMRSVEILDDSAEYLLGTDDSGNLFTFKRNTEATKEEDGKRLEPQSEIHLGEFVNVIRQGSLSSQPYESTATAPSNSVSSESSSSTPQAPLLHPVLGTSTSSCSYLFGTVSGQIGTILTLSKENYLFYSQLENSVRSQLGMQGGLSHSDYRAFASDRRSSPQRNAVDGDLVERLLELPSQIQQEIVRKLNEALHSTLPSQEEGSSPTTMSLGTLISADQKEKAKAFSVEDVLRRVEEISRLH